MDYKTMEYMAERVDKGRKIMREIKDLKERVEGLQANSYTSIAFFTNTSREMRLRENNEMMTDIRDAAIVIVLDRIKALKSDFDEL
jgi:hypothetical protein